MRDDGYCSDDKRRRRESCQSFTCISPWFIFSRLFSGNKPKGGSKIKVERKWEDEKIDENLNIRNEEMKGYDASSSCSAPNDDSEIQKEASFNLVVGFGLIYLVAASRNELHKMAELHKKIELLLQNFPTELQIQGKKQPFLPSKSTTTFVASSSNTHDQETLHEEEHDPGQYLSSHDVIKSPEIGLGSNRYRREKSLKMDQLEAELAAEFDRLQLQIDTQQSLEVDVEDSAPEESQSTNFEEVISEVQPDESSNYYEFYGVCPSELERRLHELLESRQHERIIELESALECTMQQLEEKENQLSWWKDTARLVSQHLPGLPSLFMRDVTQSSRRDETKILSLGFEKKFGIES
ncbi:hypothetical protein ACJIZ3_001483 [Penstemon smallii]|uniref:Uncharacterized protein n=1 Tax=Penstemon smallii TaxID=265156 RepID=A0ABD3U522_9LAMI